MYESIKFRPEKLDNFGIITDHRYPGTQLFDSYDRQEFLNLINENYHYINEFDKCPQYCDSYKYYLMINNKNVSKWYKKESFTFFTCECDSKLSQLIFVKNNITNWLDNVVYRRFLDDIKSRIDSNSNIYVANCHAIDRAMERIPQLSQITSRFKISSWLIKQANNSKIKKAHIKNEYSAFSLLTHNFEKADYYMDFYNNIYVVVDHVLTTVHCNESERWAMN